MVSDDIKRYETMYSLHIKGVYFVGNKNFEGICLKDTGDILPPTVETSFIAAANMH